MSLVRQMVLCPNLYPTLIPTHYKLIDPFDVTYKSNCVLWILDVTSKTNGVLRHIQLAYIRCKLLVNTVYNDY